MPVVADSEANSLVTSFTNRTLTLALMDGDPRDGGVELAAVGGYARVTLAAAAWATAVSRARTTTNPAQFPNPTAAWSATATWWALYDGATCVFAAPLATPVTVSAAGGTGPRVYPTVWVA